MRAFKNHIALIVLVLAAFSLRAQDGAISPYWFTPVFVNPAETGNFDGTIRASAVYQNQWLAGEETFTTSGGSVEISLGKEKNDNGYLSLGGAVIQDKAGTTQMGYFTGLASSAYHLKLNRKNSLSAGLQLGWTQRNMKTSDLRWDAQWNGIGYDPTLPTQENFSAEMRSFFDGAFGLNWQRISSRDFSYSLGYAAHHIMQDQTFLEEGNGRFLMRHTAYGKVQNNFGWADVTLHGRFMMQGGAKLYEIGAVGEKRIGDESRFTNYKTSSAILGGFNFRWASEVTPFVGFEFKRSFKIAMCYAIRFGEITNYAGGNALQINLIYEGSLKPSRKKLN
ncbi:PorP/SprF family type IX secretion system membrane protein [Halocola ammonii]